MSEQPRPDHDAALEAANTAGITEASRQATEATTQSYSGPVPGEANQPSSYEFLAPPQGSGELGRLGPYRIIKVLGAGGMGIVFQAEDPQLQRLVALKVMKPGLAASLSARERFLREARAAAAIEHDHIVPIYQVGEDRGVPFLAMPLLRGETLEERLKREGKPPLTEVLRIGQEIAEGLAAAHERGLMHRDIKPANLWLEGERGRVKIVDFGLARAIGQDTQLTQQGVLLGTPNYMAPEQASGHRVDWRCDLFALGCVLYRLCTGRLPFKGGDVLATLTALALEQPQPPRELNPLIPRPLSDFVLRLLAKDPGERPSARAVAEALCAMRGHGPDVPPGGITSPEHLERPIPSFQATNVHTWPGEHTLGAVDQPGYCAHKSEAYLSQLRLLVEELSCDLCRFEHVTQDGLAPEAIRIDREVDLGVPGAYADIRVMAPGQPPYFVEVKFGYSRQRLLPSLRRKFGKETPANQHAAKVVLVIDAAARPDWPQLEREVSACLHPHLKLEIWNEERLIQLLRDRFGVTIGSVTEDDLLEVRQAIDRAKGFHAFGGSSLAEYDNDPLRAELLWHFGFWRLRQLRETQGLTPRDILPPGLYRSVAVLAADLCSFSGYVHDTREEEVIRDCLTSFYSKTRYQVLNNGGMLYQFMGDGVFALFGLPDQRLGYHEDALTTAQSLLSIGLSVSTEWQRHIDRAQPSGGLHIGLAVGDVQIVSLRPFSRTHVAPIGDPIHVASQLLAHAGPNEIVVSNSFYQGLDDEVMAAFRETKPVEARNVGRIKAWKLTAAS